MSKEDGTDEVRVYNDENDFEDLLNASPQPFSPAYLKAQKQSLHQERQRPKNKVEEGPQLIASDIDSLSLRDIELAISRAKSQESRERLRVLLVMKKIELKKIAQAQEAERMVGTSKSYKSAYHNKGRRHMRNRHFGRYSHH